MMSPVAVLVEVAGEPGEICSPANATDYDADSPDDFVPGAPVVTPVRGVYYKNTEVETRGTIEGHFLIEATSRPAGLVADVSQLAFRNRQVAIGQIDERVFMAEIDGYLLTLKA